MRVGGDEGSPAKRGEDGREIPPHPQSAQPGRRAPPGDLLTILQSDWLSRRPPLPSSLPCVPALQAYWSER